MAEFRFASKEQEYFFYSMMKKCNNHDSYTGHSSIVSVFPI